ncbi:MAG: flagellar hook-basal body complex protein, partial [Pirellulales bacterium]|nr:flagellar hook-basal body complex protein [Pirellulales bacterium]
TPGTYWYKVVYCNSTVADPPAYLDSESMASNAFSATVGVGDTSMRLTNGIPTDAGGNYRSRHIYRTTVDPADPATATYSYVGEISNNVDDFFNDITADGALGAALNEEVIDGSYNYYVTFINASGVESRPSPVIEALPIDNGRIQLLDLPVQTAGDQWVSRKIYRNTSDNQSTFYEIATISDADTVINFTDNIPDTVAETGGQLDFNGPRITSGTPLINVIQLGDNNNYVNTFDVGTLEFTGRKGERNLAPKEMTIESTSTVGQLVQFMEESMGIQTPPGPDLDHVIPDDGPTGDSAGGTVDSSTGQIVFVSNNGVDNAVEVFTGSLQLTTGTPPNTDTQTRDLNFSSVQTAVGNSAVTDFIAYDSLGMDVRVRITAVMEDRTNSETIYRWFADSPENQPLSGDSISVGTGLIYFDSDGNFSRSTNDSISIYRRDVPSESPLEITLDFDELSGLGGSDEASLAVSRQDGSAPGTLTSFIIGDDGTIRGVFSNGITRDLGQIRMVRFTNPSGLEQKGENLFAAGVNSGLPIEGDPGSQGIGTIVAGATELSNTDIGGNLIDLILASTMYRGNTRVITTSQEMLEELLSLRR